MGVMHSEWSARVRHWIRTLKDDFYEPLGEIKWGAFRTMEHISPEEAERGNFQPVEPGFTWGNTWEYAWFKTTFTLPEEAKGKRIVMNLNPDGESTLFVNGKAFGTYRASWVTEPHHFMEDNTLTRCAEGGETFEVLMETNGSVALSSLPDGVRRIIDWKTPFSGESDRMLVVDRIHCGQHSLLLPQTRHLAVSEPVAGAHVALFARAARMVRENHGFRIERGIPEMLLVAIGTALEERCAMEGLVQALDALVAIDVEVLATSDVLPSSRLEVRPDAREQVIGVFLQLDSRIARVVLADVVVLHQCEKPVLEAVLRGSQICHPAFSVRGTRLRIDQVDNGKCSLPEWMQSLAINPSHRCNDGTFERVERKLGDESVRDFLRL